MRERRETPARGGATRTGLVVIGRIDITNRG
jgi:hypothetical protein